MSNPTPQLTEAEKERLLSLYDAWVDRGAYQQKQTEDMNLEKLGLAQWCGRQYGASFYCVTEAGMAYCQKHYGRK